MKKIIVVVLTLIIALGSLFSIDVKKIKGIIDGRQPLEQIVILERYVKENPESTELYILKAEIEIGERDYLGAKKTLEDVLKIEQNNLKALNLCGMIYYYLKDRENSFKIFKKALKIDKNNEFALYFLSIINPFENANENIVEKQTEYETDVKSLDEEYSDMGKRDFVYLLNRREVEITEAGLYNYTVHCVIKLLSAQGANYFRETSYSFNGYEFYPEVLKAGSYDKNYNFNEINRKNIVIVDKKTTNEVSLFTNRRFVAFPMPDINGESIFEFKIKFHSTGKSLGPKVYDRFLFGGFDGCVNSEYLLKYPKNLKLNILKKGDIAEESEDIDQEFVLKRYKYKNPPIYDLKGESVNIFDISPQIIVSAFNDWEEIAKWYSPIFEGIVSKGGVAKEVLASLSLEGKTPLQKVEAIYQYIQKNINYIAVELDESALRPHSPDEIYKNKFGDCKDQATFFIYLLREAGIKAYPLLISTSDNGKAEKKVPSPYYFNHMITHIPSQVGIENEIFCDTTTGVTELYNLPSPDQGVSGYAITENKTGYFKDTPIIDYSKNRIEEYYRGDTGIAGDGTLYFTERLKGAYAEMIRYAVSGKSQEEAFDYMFDYQSKTYNNLKRDDLEVEGFDRQSGDLKISLKAYDKSLTSIYFDGRHKITFKIKDINSLLNFPANLKYDYVRNFLFSYKKTIEYNFPEGYSVLEGSTKNFERENRYLKFETGANFISDNKFALYFEITFKERAIKNEDLEKILTFLAQIEREISTELIVGKKENFDYAEFYDGLIKIYEQKEVYENYIRKMSEERNYRRAKEVCDMGISKFKNEQNFYIFKANIYIDENKLEEAESVLKNYLSINDKESSIYIYLNEVYKKSRDEAKEEENLRLAVEKFQDKTEFYIELINFYNRKEEFEKSIELIDKLIVKYPNNSGFYGNLGYTYSLKRDFAEAEKAFIKSIELDSKNASSLNNIAWLYCENDVKIKEAIEYAKKAVAFEPLNDSYLDTLAEAYFKNQEYDNAIETINRAIKINPNYTYLKQQLEKIEKMKERMK